MDTPPTGSNLYHLDVERERRAARAEQLAAWRTQGGNAALRDASPADLFGINWPTTPVSKARLERIGGYKILHTAYVDQLPDPTRLEDAIDSCLLTDERGEAYQHHRGEWWTNMTGGVDRQRRRDSLRTKLGHAYWQELKDIAALLEHGITNKQWGGGPIQPGVITPRTSFVDNVIAALGRTQSWIMKANLMDYANDTRLIVKGPK
jgi:hypothetical protein